MVVLLNHGGSAVNPAVQAAVDRGAGFMGVHYAVEVNKGKQGDAYLKWIGGYVSAEGASFPTLDSLAARPTLPAAALERFRAFAAAQGVVIPPDEDERLQRVLIRSVALAKWGEEGFYRIAALLDPAVEAAAKQFERAATILSTAKEPE